MKKLLQFARDHIQYRYIGHQQVKFGFACVTSYLLLIRRLQTIASSIEMKYTILLDGALKCQKMQLRIQLFLVQNLFVVLNAITEKLSFSRLVPILPTNHGLCVMLMSRILFPHLTETCFLSCLWKDRKRIRVIRISLVHPTSDVSSSLVMQLFNHLFWHCVIPTICAKLFSSAHLACCLSPTSSTSLICLSSYGLGCSHYFQDHFLLACLYVTCLVCVWISFFCVQRSLF